MNFQHFSISIVLLAASSVSAQECCGPASGQWESYSVGYSSPTSSAFISLIGSLQRGFRDEFGTLYYADYDWAIAEGCFATPNCAVDSHDFIRRATLASDTLSFAAYWPRSYDTCFSDPLKVGLCSEYWGANTMFIDATDQSGEYVPYDSVAITGGGAIPEPASWAMMIAGLGIAGAAMRWRRVSSTA